MHNNHMIVNSKKILSGAKNNIKTKQRKTEKQKNWKFQQIDLEDQQGHKQTKIRIESKAKI